MLYARLIFAFFYYLLIPAQRRRSPLFVIVLLLGLLGILFAALQRFSFPFASFLQLSPPLPTTSLSEKIARIDVERELLQKKQADVHQLLNSYPTSRDLWLYNGWIALSLNDEGELEKTKEMLALLDPNNPQVVYFLGQL